MNKRRSGIVGNKGLLKGVLLCCAVAVIPPLVILVAYSVGECCLPTVVPWTAGEMLSYCGTLGAAFVAIFGVYWSLRANRCAQERQIRDDAAPFFAVVFLEQKNKRSFFQEELRNASRAQSGQVDARERSHVDAASPDREEYGEEDSREIYVLLDEEIAYKTGLTEDQIKHVRSYDIKEAIAPGSFAFVANPVIYIPIYLKNVGKGPAVAVRVGVNPKGSGWSGVKYWTLMPGEYFYLGIYIDTEKEVVFGEYELSVVYFDCLGCQYVQRFVLNVIRRGKDGKHPAQMAFYGPRELLGDEERERYLSNLKDLL